MPWKKYRTPLILGGTALVYVLVPWALSSQYARDVWSDGSALILMALILAVQLRNALRSNRAIRGFWTLLTIGTTLWAINQGTWFWYEVIRKQEMPDPCFGDPVLFLHVVPVMAAVLLLPHLPETSRRLYFGALNTVTLLTWWVYVYVFVVFPREFILLDIEAYSRCFDILYLLETGVVVVVVALAATGTSGPWRRLYLHFAGAMATYTIASTALDWAVTRKVYYSGSLYDVPFAVSLVWFYRMAKVGTDMATGSTPAGRGAEAWIRFSPRLTMLLVLSVPLFGLWTLLFDRSPMVIRVVRISVTLAATMILGMWVFSKQHLLDVSLRRLLREKEASEEQLRFSEEQLRLFIEHAPAALAMFDRQMCYLQASRRWLADYGLTDRQVIGISHYDLFPEISERWKEFHRRGLAGEILHEDHDRFDRADGRVQWGRWDIRPWCETGGAIGGIVIFAEDVTERTLLEQQLQQAQKMEAIGRLAGGVAHDFNNILGVITGYSELLLGSPTALNRAVVQKIEHIRLAGQKAASLTQQLLAFSRKQIVQPSVVDLNKVVDSLQAMLRRLIGEDIELIATLHNQDVPVKADPNQIDQVIMNLAVNSRDAMPKGGRLSIAIDTNDLEESLTDQHERIPAGRYAHLTVTDNGIGMSQETMARIFEPFFTTKELGKGTGLGLSTVYGIIRQAGGYIRVDSELARGTTFKIFLPLQDQVAIARDATSKEGYVRGFETVLLVEDETDLRQLVAEFLRDLGYTVLEAENGERALQIAESLSQPVQVLITDIVMPRMGGRELADRLIAKFPTLGVVYTSGYTEDSAIQTRGLGMRETFLQKPFGLRDLNAKLHEIATREAERVQAAGAC